METEFKEILEWLKSIFGAGYIRHRKTGISDYTIVDSKEVKKILLLLQPYSRLKKKQIELGLEIFNKLETLKLKNFNSDQKSLISDNKKSDKDFLEICKLVDKFKELNYSKKRKITSDVVSKSLPL